MSEFAGKKVLVLGAGISGISVSQVLSDQGASVILSDVRTEEQIGKDLSALKTAGVVFGLGRQDEELLEGVDYVVLSPGVSIYNPLVEAAKAAGKTVISEIEVAYRQCPAPVVAITGTNGKTTTTTLVGEILKAAGQEVVVGGNIGQALSHEVKEISGQGIVVAEISSFQLEAIVNFRPHVAAILNVTPDHIDRHRTLANYQATKERIFENQTEEDFIVLNYDDPIVREMAPKAASQVVYFSRREKLNEGAYVEDGKLVIKWKNQSVSICEIAQMKIFGAHNVENALAACACAFFAGASVQDMAKVLTTFSGVEHRIEPVTTISGVAYYNDSKATNPESSIKALEAFTGNVILIAGGHDKNTDLTEFMRLIKEKTDHLILLGEAKERFGEAAKDHGVTNIHMVQSFEEGVKLAHSLAKPPQIVLLSPACSSYDMFNNYEERGRVFKTLVRQLGNH